MNVFVWLKGDTRQRGSVGIIGRNEVKNRYTAILSVDLSSSLLTTDVLKVT